MEKVAGPLALLGLALSFAGLAFEVSGVEDKRLALIFGAAAAISLGGFFLSLPLIQRVLRLSYKVTFGDPLFTHSADEPFRWLALPVSNDGWPNRFSATFQWKDSPGFKPFQYDALPIGWAAMSSPRIRLRHGQPVNLRLARCTDMGNGNWEVIPEPASSEQAATVHDKHRKVLPENRVTGEIVVTRALYGTRCVCEVTITDQGPAKVKP